MRKNNSGKLKQPNAKPAKAKRKKPSIPSKKASSANAISSRESGDPGTFLKNSRWNDLLDKHPELDRLVTQAIELKLAEKPRQAADVLEEAVRKYPEEAPLFWYLGGIYLHDLDQPRKAIPFCRKATILAPTSQRASLGLFHALWAADEIHEALAEIKRYQTLTNFKCRDYIEITAEIDEKWSDRGANRKTAKH